MFEKGYDMKSREIVRYLLTMVLSVCLLLCGGNALAAKPGDLVLSQWTDGFWYPARVAEVSKGRVLVSYYDGDVGTVSKAQVKAFNWKVGSKIQCNWKRAGVYYSGTIKKMKVEWIHMKYDDGDQEKTGIGRCRVK